MSHPSKQNSQEKASKNNPNLNPEAMQGTDDTQSEFTVSATREERREDERKTEGQTNNAAPETESNTAETQSEFSVDDRLRGKS